MALTSWLRGVARTSTSRARGVIRAPPMPCRKREATKVSSENDIEQAIDPSTKTRIDQRKMLLAPNRSAIQPETGMKMASATR